MAVLQPVREDAHSVLNAGVRMRACPSLPSVLGLPWIRQAHLQEFVLCFS